MESPAPFENRTGSAQKELLRFRALADHVPGFLALVDARTLCYQFVNLAFETSFGIPRDQIVGSPVWNIIGQANYEFALPFIEQARQGTAVSYENTFGLTDGRRWVRVNYSPIFGDQGQVEALAVLSYDITEQRKAEDELSRYFENSPDMVCIATATGFFKKLNPEWERVLGYSRQELMARPFLEFVHPQDRRATEDEVGRLARGDRTLHFTNRYRHRDGTYRWLEWNSIAVNNGDLFASARDISVHRAAEQELWETKAILQAALDQSPAGIAIADAPDGTLRYVNDAGLLIRGGDRDSVVRGVGIGEYVARWQLLDLDGRPLKTEEVPLARALLYGETNSRQFIIRREDSEDRIVLANAAPVRNPRNEVQAAIVVFSDITEQRRSEEALKRVDRLEALGILAGGIAHDFNNLLTGIFGYLELAQLRTAPEDPVRRYLEKALSVYQRAKHLTMQLLTFSKGGDPVRSTGSLATRVVESTMFALSGSNVTAQFDLPDDLALCDFDDNQIGQVVDNLIINAQQAMPLGGTVRIAGRNVTVKAGDPMPLAPGTYVRISIADEGAGIPPPLRERIFDPFFTTKPKGTGLGLTTCFSIMKKHAGLIDVDPGPSPGTTIHLYLPSTSRPPSPFPPVAVVVPRGRGRILVMDDEDFILDLVRDLLTGLGYSPVLASDGREAFTVMHETAESGEPVAAALLDLTVPGGWGGKETLLRIRESWPDLPVFATSGYSEDPVMAHPETFGFTGSIAKPYVQRELAALLDRFLTTGP